MSRRGSHKRKYLLCQKTGLDLGTLFDNFPSSEYLKFRSLILLRLFFHLTIFNGLQTETGPRILGSNLHIPKNILRDIFGRSHLIYFLLLEKLAAKYFLPNREAEQSL